MKQLFTAVAFAASLATSFAQAETYTWLTYKPQGANDAQSITTQWFVEQFAERTGGKHSIEVFWGGSVAGVGEIPEALANGVGSMGDIVTPYFPDLLPINNAIGFFIPQPMNSRQVGEAMENWHAKYSAFSQELADQNLHAIAFRPLEDFGLLCKEPVESIADMKGKRVRTYGFAYPALFEAMGATPVSITTSDTYEALERSIIDCTPIGPALARGWKYDEVAKYYMEMPLWASFGHIIGMNLDAYNAMDDETRAVLDQLGKDYLVEYSRVLNEFDAEVRELWKGDLNVNVLAFPKEELTALVNDPKVRAVRQEWEDKAAAAGLPVSEVIEEMQF